MSLRRLICSTFLGISALAICSCASTRIAIAESFGYAKREQLVSKVQSARDGQEEAREQFADALEEFLAVTEVEVGELESQYRQLNAAYESSKRKADTVRSRIKSVERVAAALFNEWEAELSEYSSDSLRAASQRQLNDTRRQYDRLIAAMKAAEEKMAPVLAAFADQVLFLKHNLNARAIASLQQSVASIESDVGRLIEEMNQSIAEADRFISQMSSEADSAD